MHLLLKVLYHKKWFFFFVPKNLLALGGEDKCITVSNVDGDTIRQVRICCKIRRIPSVVYGQY